jgi:two-component system phosphate regulon sensor histidine kinase PhoR
MKRLRWLAILMGITILGIAGFQGYWLKNNYERERQNLEIKTSSGFHQTVLQLQASRLNLDKLNLQWEDSLPGMVKAKVVVRPRDGKHRTDSFSPAHKAPAISIVNLLQERLKELGADSAKARAYVLAGKNGVIHNVIKDSAGNVRFNTFNTQIESIAIKGDSMPPPGILKEVNVDKNNKTNVVTVTYGATSGKANPADSLKVRPEAVFVENHGAGVDQELVGDGVRSLANRKNTVFRFLYNMDSVSIRDSVKVSEIATAYSQRLKEDHVPGLLFAVSRQDSSAANSDDQYDVTIGFAKPITYHLTIENKMSFLLKKLTLPILFSIFLVGITVLSFILLYRNLVRQRRLTELKNEFIRNITHELKTPIATVGVAIEALKNFNAIHDPERTREYLDISQNELQRLSLLVDKVLKLSMFEKKELELKKEQFDCKLLVEEVMNSMRLQFEKYRAKVKLHTEGTNFIVDADKLHITSVIYNLLDNALKYSRESPVIDVSLKSSPEHLEFSVSDNGIGIPPAYTQRVFDKFFRVPTGDRHNIKGYGLGLSYVSEVLKRHHGHVSVESELGKGSTFTATFPYA